MVDPIAPWLAAFALTVGIELPIAFYLLQRNERGAKLRGSRARRVAAAIVFANLCTHPAVWFVFPALLEPRVGRWGYIAGAESWAVVVEALFYWVFVDGVDLRTAFGVSLVANGASATLGILLWQWLGGLLQAV